jgi:hypothetical protein
MGDPLIITFAARKKQCLESTATPEVDKSFTANRGITQTQMLQFPQLGYLR